MATYKLTEEAKAALIRIYHYGVQRFGETQADEYFAAFFDRFEDIAKTPYLYPSADDIRKGYRKSVCGSDTIYYQIENDIVEIIDIIGRQDTDNALK